MRRSLPVLLALLLGLGALVACGDDEGDDGGDEAAASVEDGPSDELCDLLEPVGELSPSVQPTEEDLDVIRAAGEAAPSDASSAFDQLVAVGEVAIDPEGDFGSLDFEAMEDARATLQGVAEECGVDLPVLSVLGGAAPETEEFDSGAFREVIEAESPGLDVQTVGRFNDQITVQVVDVDEPSALVVCESAAAYLEGIDFTAEVRITDTEDMAFANLPAGGTCQAGDL